MTATKRNPIQVDELNGVEIVSQRDRHTKVFDLGCGRRQAVIFTEPVHFRSADGAWREIDNTLEETTVNGASVFRNHANDAVMTFDRLRGDASLSRDGRTFRWKLLGAQDAVPVVHTGAQLRSAALNLMTRAEAAARTTAKALRGDVSEKLISRLDFANLRPGVSVRYTLGGTQMKQDILLDNAEAVKDAALLLPKTFRYQVAEDMHVDVLDPETDELLFVFESPETYDAKGAATLAVVTLAETEDGVILRYSLPEAFLSEAAFPVTIDPVVRTATTDAVVSDAYIWKKRPSNNYGNVHLMRCGLGEGGESIALVKFEKLVKIRASDTILSAQLCMHEQNYGNDKEYMGCYPIKTAWTEYGVTWNNMTPANTDHISGDMIAYVTGTTGFRYFDITALYRTWYLKDANGVSRNNGVAIRFPAGISSSNNYVEWTGAKNNVSGSPRMYVTYVSHAGRQDWWQYESMSCGRAGSAYVDLYNGNLVYEHADGATVGARMPVAIKHVYNSCLSESNPVSCGNGWRTSMHQQVSRQAIDSTNYYVWLDGGATEHYFPISGSQPYKDAEGMELKLTTSGSTLTITDKSNTRMEFPLPSNAAWQNLTQIVDSCGNRATLTYSGGKLTQVKDGVNHAVDFVYNGNGLLSQMKIQGSPSISFAYSGTNLTGVTYADVTSGGTTFTYESGSNMLIGAQNFDGVKLNIGFEPTSSYDSAAIDSYAAQIRRVISLEQTAGSVKGAKQLFDYYQGSTKVTAVANASSDAGKVLTYAFNTAGNLLCVYDELGYAQSNTFSASVANQLTSASKLQKAVENLATNIDFGSGWTTVKGATGDAVARDTSVRCLNMPTLKLTKTGAAETRQTHTVSSVPAGSYTFSAYVKNTAVLASGGLFLRVRSGSAVWESRKLTGATAAYNTDSAADGWDRLYVTATLTQTANVTLELVSTAPSGSAWFACPQLEQGSIPNRANLLINGDFTYEVANGGRKFPQYWTVENGVDGNALNGLVDKAAAGMPAGLSGRAARIAASINRGNQSFTQRIALNGKAGDVYVVGGWANTQSVASGVTNFEPKMVVRFLKGGSFLDCQFKKFSTARVGWQFGCWAVAAPSDYDQVLVGVCYEANAQTGMFTNLFFHREEFGQSFEYDAEAKNLISVSSLSKQKASMEYDDANNLKSYRQPGADESVKYTMNYGANAAEQAKHLLLSSVTPMGQRDVFTYDAYGNNLTSVRQKSGDSAYIRMETAYNADGSFAASTKDARGNTVVQNVNAETGLLASITDPNGQTVSYAYDASKRVTGVETTAGGKTYKNAYTYANDRIQKVQHNTTTDTPDVEYAFGYDALGRKTSVKVGNQTLSTNVYTADRSGLLSEVQYGNGGKVKYAYDAYDRLTGVKHDGETSDRYTYEYGADGEASIVRDNNLGRTLQTERDLAQRAMGTQLRDGSGNLLYRTELDYDTQNRLVGFGETASGRNYKTAYEYDNDNRVIDMSFDDSNHILYSYDALGRIASRTTTPLTISYGYVGGGYGTGSTTPLVASIQQTGIPFSYAYDSRGNIISETRNGKATSYAYDALGQLIRVNDPHLNQTWVFNYDRGGNILSKVRYAYTTGTLGTALETIPYTYGDANWKDKLTAYNGKSITYDAIGNPLNDGTWSYEWQAGRQLKRMSAEGKALTFQYDHNGLRTQKVVEADWYPETTNYYLHGKLLTHMTVDYRDTSEAAHQDVMHFFYDAQSRPAKVSYNGAIYTYVHNLQGDVVGLLDNSGNLVVEYKYDAWGKAISTIGSLAATLGKRNPFRYRGYIYDEETGLYYLRSRYYNPVVGRFVNADEFIAARKDNLDHNLFAYCTNAPVKASDEDGHWSKALKSLAYVVAAIIAKIVVPAIGAEVQLVVNRAKAKKAIRDSGKRQTDYLVNYPYGGAENAVVEGIVGKYEWLYKQVNHGAPMDYKAEDRKPWWALGCSKFYFRGRMISFEEYGNLNYGYVGKALGIADWIIYAGGGFAAFTGGGDKSWNPGYFFDSEDDHNNIAWGIDIYKEAWGND